MIAKRPNRHLRPVFRVINEVMPDLKPRGTSMLRLVNDTYAVGIYLGPEARAADLTFYGASIIVDPLFMTNYPEGISLGPRLHLGHSESPEVSWRKLANRANEAIESLTTTRACFEFIVAHRSMSTLTSHEDHLTGARPERLPGPFGADSLPDLEDRLVGALWEGLFDEANATLTQILEAPTRFDFEINCRSRCVARMDVLFERGLAGIRVLLEKERAERLALIRAERLS